MSSIWLLDCSWSKAATSGASASQPLVGKQEHQSCAQKDDALHLKHGIVKFYIKVCTKPSASQMYVSQKRLGSKNSRMSQRRPGWQETNEQSHSQWMWQVTQSMRSALCGISLTHTSPLSCRSEMRSLFTQFCSALSCSSAAQRSSTCALPSSTACIGLNMAHGS